MQSSQNGRCFNSHRVKAFNFPPELSNLRLPLAPSRRGRLVDPARNCRSVHTSRGRESGLAGISGLFESSVRSLGLPFCRSVVLPALVINARLVFQVFFVFGLCVELWRASQDLSFALWRRVDQLQSALVLGALEYRREFRLRSALCFLVLFVHSEIDVRIVFAFRGFVHEGRIA